MHPLEQDQTSQEADPRLPVRSLPERLAKLINPAVLAEHPKRVGDRLDLVAGRVLRRRCAELIANHLLESTEDAA